MTVADLRKEFAKLRRNALTECSLNAWMYAVRKLLPENPTPEDWVEAARKATVRCWRCQGSGLYQWGACVNGRMTHSGPCFRCEGKGKQGQADFRRNYGHNMHIRVV